MGSMGIKGLLTDLDGTLYVGDEPVEGAKEALESLRGAGISLRYVTNTTRKPRRAVRDHMLSLGFEVSEEEIFTPARAAATLLAGKSCYPLLDEALLEDLGELRFASARHSPDYVLVGDLGEEFAYGPLNEAFQALMDGAELVALQKNRYWRKEDGLGLDAGPFVAALEYASAKSATVVGKPEESFFRLALEELGTEPSEAAMVGDDPESDVAGARAAGMKGFQVRTGKYVPGSGGEPDLLLDSFAGLPEALGI